MTQRERDALAARVREDAEWAASAERHAEEELWASTFASRPNRLTERRSEILAEVSEDTVPPRTFANVRATGQAWRWVAFFVLWCLAMFAVLAGAYVMSRGA